MWWSRKRRCGRPDHQSIRSFPPSALGGNHPATTIRSLFRPWIGFEAINHNNSNNNNNPV